MKATSSPSSSTPLKERTNAVQSTPRSVQSSRSSIGVDLHAGKPSGRDPNDALSEPLHPEDEEQRADDQPQRSDGNGAERQAKPATITASTANPAAAPSSVERQPRVVPTPTTIVTISIASTAEARNAVISTGTMPSCLHSRSVPVRAPEATAGSTSPEPAPIRCERPDDLPEILGGEMERCRVHPAVDLRSVARPNDGAGHPRPRQRPGHRHG